jgi:hypothetical protein
MDRYDFWASKMGSKWPNWCLFVFEDNERPAGTHYELVGGTMVQPGIFAWTQPWLDVLNLLVAWLTKEDPGYRHEQLYARVVDECGLQGDDIEKELCWMAPPWYAPGSKTLELALLPNASAGAWSGSGTGNARPGMHYAVETTGSLPRVTEVKWVSRMFLGAVDPNEAAETDSFDGTKITGRRIYSGARGRYDIFSFLRDDVLLAAVVEGATEDPEERLPVHIALIDVDDPSAVDSPVDLTPDGWYRIGADNRWSLRNAGSFCEEYTRRYHNGPEVLAGRQEVRPTPLDDQLAAQIDVEVGLRPGDNYQAVAAYSKVAVAAAIRQYLAVGSLPNDGSVQISPMLTVWRRLNLDVDSMDRVRGNGCGGFVYSYRHITVTHNTGNTAEFTELLVSKLSNGFDEDHHFGGPTARRGGQLFLSKGQLRVGPLDILDNYDAGDVTVLRIRRDSDVAGWDYYEVRDDDLYTEPEWSQPVPPVELPIRLPTGILAAALGQVYISLSESPKVEVAPFVLNQKNTRAAAINLDDDHCGDATWWVAHVTAAYQGKANRDYDNDEEVTQHGITGPHEGSFVFLEVVRDFSKRKPAERRTVYWDLVGETVAHEIGHQFGLDNGGLVGSTTYLMAADDTLGEKDRSKREYMPSNKDHIRTVSNPMDNPPWP